MIDLTISDKIIKDTIISSRPEKSDHSDQADTEQSETTAADVSVQSSSSDQEQILTNITDEMQQSVNNTQSSEVLPKTGIKDGSNMPIGYTILSSSILLFAVSLKIVNSSLKKLI